MKRYDLSPEQFEAAYAAFQDAVAKAPGQIAFANVCRCTQGNISQLLAKRSLLPERHVLKVEAATGVARHLLRPDIYPVAPDVTGADQSVVCDRKAVLQRSAAA